MDALLMCGGRGTRLETDVEKPLVRIAGRPMIDRVLTALEDSRVDRVLPVVSPHAPATRDHLAERSGAGPPIETPGEGYVADIGTALDDDRVERPVLTVVCDLAVLDPGPVDVALGRFDGRDLTVLVPGALKRALGLSEDATRHRDDHATDDHATDDHDGREDCVTAPPHGGPELAPTGLNIVGDEDRGDALEHGREGTHDGAVVIEHGTEVLLVSYDARLAVNVNRPADVAVAEVLADGP